MKTAASCGAEHIVDRSTTPRRVSPPFRAAGPKEAYDPLAQAAV
jgi:hypothetical protein